MMNLNEDEKKAITNHFHNGARLMPLRINLIEAKAEEERVKEHKKLMLHKRRVIAELEGDPNAAKDYIDGMSILTRSICFAVTLAHTDLYTAVGLTK